MANGTRNAQDVAIRSAVTARPASVRRYGAVRRYLDISEVQPVDPLMTNVSIKFRNNMYIAERVLPVVPVATESGTYVTYGRENLNIPANLQRAPRSEAASAVQSASSATYTCLEFAFKEAVDDRERATALAPLDPAIDAVEFVSDVLLLAEEYRVATLLFNTTTFSGYTAALSGTDRWDDYANSDPVGKVATAADTILPNCAKAPNMMVVGQAVFTKLKEHPDILDRIKYTQTGLVTEDLLAKVFNVDNFLVGRAVYNTAAEGATASYGFVWGKFALLCYVEPRPALRKPSLGYIPRMGGGTWMRLPYREEKIHSDWYEGSQIQDEIVMAANCGYLYSTVIT